MPGFKQNKHTKFWSVNSAEIDRMGQLNVYGRIILKCIQIKVALIAGQQ